MTMFIVTGIFMVSLAAVLYLIVRALPRVSEEPGTGDAGASGRNYSELPEKIDAFINGFTFKFLRKLKVTTLKLDNSLSRHLQRIKPEESDRRNGIDFKEIAGQGGGAVDKKQEL